MSDIVEESVVIADDTPQEDTSIEEIAVVEEAPALELSGEAFVSNLQYGSEADMNLHLHIVDNGAVDSTGKLTPKTVEMALSTGMSEAVIEQHQQAIYQDIEAKIVEVKQQYKDSCSELGLNIPYMDTVIGWARESFTPAEIKVLEDGFAKDPTGELKALEQHYIKENK